MGRLRTDAPPPAQMARLAAPRAGLLLLTRRAIRWVLAVLALAAASAWDWLRGRRSLEQRARRLRLMFEAIGGTAIKVGQQLSMRIDLLPFEVCHELSKMLDSVGPFPVELALAAVERAIAPRRLEEVFEAFDPVPIGSASVACVYQARLHGGERVAVKVRRPDVLEVFNADLTILELLLTVLEQATLVRPGQFQYLRREVRSMLMEELSFRAEARYQKLFRERAEEDKLDYVRAPQVFEHLCSEEVLVTEFVSGVWCWEVLSAVEGGDPEALRALEQAGIDPARVAERLFKASLWGTYEHLFFHADPHPGNIVVQPGDQLVFIDFGACGTTSERSRELNLEIIACREYDDAEGMARALLRLLEPLPHINTYELEKRLEALAWRHLFAVRDADAAWWERATASLWISFMTLARDYSLPVNPDTVRLMRATFLYDTLCARLDPKIDPLKVWRKWQRQAVRRANRRARRRLRRRLRRERDRSVLTQVEESLRGAEQLSFEFSRVRERIPVRREAVVSKLSYFVSTLLRGAIVLSAVFGASVAWLGLSDRAGTVTAWEALRRLASTPWALVILVLVVITTLRKLLYRFGDKDDD
jgi:predicted unusual protein kinase regulating ubiquinone biosynthesis (AarF/ABC1/UbiB family)